MSSLTMNRPLLQALPTCTACKSAVFPVASVSCSSAQLRHCSSLRSAISPRRRRSTTVCEVALKVEAQSSKAGAGSKIRVKGPLKVYHVPKVPELELDGMEGEVKDVLTTWKGKNISANLPYKVQFHTVVGDKTVKFVSHLRDGEFEVIE